MDLVIFVSRPGVFAEANGHQAQRSIATLASGDPCAEAGQLEAVEAIKTSDGIPTDREVDGRPRDRHQGAVCEELIGIGVGQHERTLALTILHEVDFHGTGKAVAWRDLAKLIDPRRWCRAVADIGKRSFSDAADQECEKDQWTMGACGDTGRPCVLARSMLVFKSPIAHSAEWNVDDRTRGPRTATAEAEDERLLRSGNLQTDEG